MLRAYRLQPKEAENEANMRKEIQTDSSRTVVVDLTGDDRIRRVSPGWVNAKVARDMENRIERLSGENKAVISDRINRLDDEWDIDRSVMVNFAIVGTLTLMLTRFKDRRFINLLQLQMGFMLAHAFSGWCPPVSVFRRLGFRSRMEIDAEKYALKTLRGDFEPGLQPGAKSA